MPTQDLPTPSDEIIRSKAEPQLSQAVGPEQEAAAIREVEVAQDWKDSGNGLSEETARELERQQNA